MLHVRSLVEFQRVMIHDPKGLTQSNFGDPNVGMETNPKSTKIHWGQYTEQCVTLREMSGVGKPWIWINGMMIYISLTVNHSQLNFSVWWILIDHFSSLCMGKKHNTLKSFAILTSSKKLISGMGVKRWVFGWGDARWMAPYGDMNHQVGGYQAGIANEFGGNSRWHWAKVTRAI